MQAIARDASAECVRVHWISQCDEHVKKMLNGPQTLSVDRVITENSSCRRPVVLPQEPDAIIEWRTVND
jgi:hypothetical protein